MMLSTKISKNFWCNSVLKRHLCLTSKVNMKIPKGVTSSQKTLASKKYKYLRKLEGFPSPSEAPHIKLIYNCEYENYMFCYNPLTMVSTPMMVLFSKTSIYNAVGGNMLVVSLNFSLKNKIF